MNENIPLIDYIIEHCNKSMAIAAISRTLSFVEEVMRRNE
jgi:hypothetical protein